MAKRHKSSRKKRGAQLAARYAEKAAQKAARLGRGGPIATVALYGPNKEHATKLVLGLIEGEGEEPTRLETHFVEGDRNFLGDARAELLARMSQFVEETGAKRTSFIEETIGCPHEQGVDYKEAYCPDPACEFWVGRDRFTGELLH